MARVEARLAALLLALLLSGCADRAPAAAPGPLSVTDDLGHEVRLAAPARRVVTLVPSATETLVALGALDRLVGRTQHDTRPEVLAVPSVGAMLEPSMEALLALDPDLVVVQADDKALELRERLREVGVPIFGVYARDTADVFRNVRRLGALVGRDAAADSLIGAMRAGLAEVRASVAGRLTPSVLYVVWHDPPITPGPETYIAQLIGVAGGRTIFPDLEQDWPMVAMEEIVRRQPDVVVMPVGGNRSHSARPILDAPGWRELRAVREGRVAEVPVDLMNRPGPYLAEAARVLRDALHPGAARR
jgi:iron complex transport system substrate-binding protein